MFMFGCITIAQGFVKNYFALLATRFLLGLAESSILPGCFYIIAMYVYIPHSNSAAALSFSIRWYKRGESQKRFTFFFGSTTLAGAFGGLLAYGISKLDGKAGLASWRWIFVIGMSVSPFPAVVS